MSMLFNDLLGQTICTLLGTSSEAELFSAISAAAEQSVTSVPATLISQHGFKIDVLATCTPFEQDSVKVCKVDFKNFTLTEAECEEYLEDSASAKVLVSVDYPRIIKKVNRQFTELFGYIPNQITGRSIRAIHGPRTNLKLWNLLLDTAASARCTAEDQHFVSSVNCGESLHRVSCSPVLHGYQGKVRGLLVSFSQPGADPSPCADEAS
jgi:hypothetical protein